MTAVNEELKTSPDKINEAPHETWIIKVELSDPGQFEKLLDAAAYEKFVSEETEASKSAFSDQLLQPARNCDGTSRD